MVPADSDRVSRAPPYSGLHPLGSAYAYGTITPFGPAFQRVRLRSPSVMVPLQPRRRRNGTGLGWSPFARRYSGNHCCFLLLRVLRCFSSPGLPPDESGYRAFSSVGCPIRTPADRWVCAPPRGFSQLVASFIASGSLGIPRAPLITSRALSRTAFARLIASLSLHYLHKFTIVARILNEKNTYFVTPPPRQRTSRPQ